MERISDVLEFLVLNGTSSRSYSIFRLCFARNEDTCERLFSGRLFEYAVIPQSFLDCKTNTLERQV